MAATQAVFVVLLIAIGSLIYPEFNAAQWLPWDLKPEPVANVDGGFELRYVFHRNLVADSDEMGMFRINPSRLTAVGDDRDPMIFPAAESKERVIPRLPFRTVADIEQQRIMARQARRQNKRAVFEASYDDLWVPTKVTVPDLDDRDTVLLLANMAANAYVPTPHEGDWTNLTSTGEVVIDGRWRHDDGFGWMEDGVRGYVFVSRDDSQVVISIKGTSAAVFDDGGPTAPKDKINDNLFFSCCCARISYMWNTVCDCYLGSKHGTQMCDESCVEDALWEGDNYYRGVLDVYDRVSALYPDANIWLTGHSLGGALSSLLGRTFGLPAVTFEAPGEQLAARRLHLPTPPGRPVWEDHIWHIGHNADPIYTGDCNGPGSSCWYSGYAMETRCHTGLLCVYDVVSELGWRPSIANHRIHVVIDDVILKYNDSALCLPAPPCVECDGWQFIDPLDPPPVTSTLSSVTREPPMPSTTTAETSDTTISTSVCLTREWYGLCRSWGEPPVTATVNRIAAGSG